jgi:hypothetical protein
MNASFKEAASILYNEWEIEIPIYTNCTDDPLPLLPAQAIVNVRADLIGREAGWLTYARLLQMSTGCKIIRSNETERKL